MINKIRNWAVAAILCLFFLPLAPAQITPNLWKEFIGEPVVLVTPGLIDHSYAGYKNGAEGIPETFTQPVFNVNDYGATPDDNASDTAGITAALNAANANGQGGIVFFAAGQYDIFLDGETLLANYPNPFNPETWIPYQLAKAADVTITIYTSDGNVVRTLAVGHQEAGMYTNSTQAGYWDGKNALGESVASGVYFYTLIAGDFAATRKMIILK